MDLTLRAELIKLLSGPGVCVCVCVLGIFVQFLRVWHWQFSLVWLFRLLSHFQCQHSYIHCEFVKTFKSQHSSLAPSVFWLHNYYIKQQRESQNKSLSTDAGQRLLPYQYSIEVAHLQVQPLVLCTSQTKPNGQEHQGQSGHPCKHKADCPHVKPKSNTHSEDVASRKGAEIIV